MHPSQSSNRNGIEVLKPINDTSSSLSDATSDTKDDKEEPEGADLGTHIGEMPGSCAKGIKQFPETTSYIWTSK